MESPESPDAQPWEWECAFACFGASIGLRASTPALGAAALSCLPPGSRILDAPAGGPLIFLYGESAPEGDRPGRFRVYGNGRCLMTARRQEDALLGLETVLRTAVARECRAFTFVHAGAVEVNGRAILIPGASRSGKTTLVKALLAQGAVYYTDEFAVLDSEGRLIPFPCRLSVREGDGDRARRVSAEALGARVGVGPARIGLVARLEYRAGVGQSLRHGSSGEAVLALVENRMGSGGVQAETIGRMTRALRDARFVRGVRGEAEEAAKALIGLCESAHRGRLDCDTR